MAGEIRRRIVGRHSLVAALGGFLLPLVGCAVLDRQSLPELEQPYPQEYFFVAPAVDVLAAVEFAVRQSERAGATVLVRTFPSNLIVWTETRRLFCDRKLPYRVSEAKPSTTTVVTVAYIRSVPGGTALFLRATCYELPEGAKT